MKNSKKKNSVVCMFNIDSSMSHTVYTSKADAIKAAKCECKKHIKDRPYFADRKFEAELAKPQDDYTSLVWISEFELAKASRRK